MDIQPIDLDRINLKRGNTDMRNETEMCAMEFVAWLGGESHTDHPACADPILAAFVRTWNDDLSDADRNRLLKPYLRRIVGTRGTAKDEDRRAWVLTDWIVREMTPAWLELAGLTARAAALRALPEVTRDTCDSATPAVMAARKEAAAAGAAAWDAAWAAARDAAWAAAGAAAGDAAWDAAGDAAWDAAGDAAWDAAGDAAWAAAWAAAWDAAGDAAGAAAGAAARDRIRPTVEALQVSACGLLDRLIAVTEAEAT